MERLGESLLIGNLRTNLSHKIEETKKREMFYTLASSPAGNPLSRAFLRSRGFRGL